MFQIIHTLSWKCHVKTLCCLAQVSLSGYYKHKKLILSCNTKEHREKQDVEIITREFLKSHQKYGYRMICMSFIWQWMVMNPKKILRLMKKYKLQTKVRKKRPYSQIAKANQEHRTFWNILKREFKGIIPRKKLWTDITYLYYSWWKCYLSILKDMVTGEVLSHKISNNLWLDFVIYTIKTASHLLQSWSIIQSDQWWHYTHPIYSNTLKIFWVIQSMSRKWNCLDNAPTESFFWHMKDEIDLKSCKNIKDVENVIHNYMIYYNNHRFQWNKKKMTPVQYRNHLLGL